MSYRIRTNCRACSWGPPIGPGGIKSASPNDSLISVFNLGVMPLPNAFRKAGESRPGHYPVELLVCPRCHLGQLSAVVDPAVLYDNYPYVTSTSETMRRHFDSLWKSLNQERKIEGVIEIGSNDGLCLDHLKSLGATTVLGIDPAKNLVQKAVKRGVRSLCCMFDREAANMASATMPKVDLILARHVFCHIDDWQSFVTNVGVLCSKETIVCIEVPYAQNTVDKCEWDQVYAEHLSYLTIRSMQFLLESTPLRLQNIIPFPVHGGAIALILRRRDSECSQNGKVQEMLDAEHCGIDAWRLFAQKAMDQITNLKILVRELKEDQKRIVGYGASAKSTVWNAACDFTRKDLAFITDSTMEKQYCTSPGTDIPIVDEGALTRELPDYAICYAWNFFLEIYEKEKQFRANGGKWILPVPEVRIV